MGLLDNCLYRLELLSEKETVMWNIDMSPLMAKDDATPLPTTNNVGDMWYAQLHTNVPRNVPTYPHFQLHVLQHVQLVSC